MNRYLKLILPFAIGICFSFFGHSQAHFVIDSSEFDAGIDPSTGGLIDGMLISSGKINGITIENTSENGILINRGTAAGIKINEVIDTSNFLSRNYGLHIGSVKFMSYLIEEMKEDLFAKSKDSNKKASSATTVLGTGIRIDSVSIGLDINYASGRAIDIDLAANGITLDSVTYNGLTMHKVGDDGIFLNKIGLNGMVIRETGGDGIYIQKAGDDAIYVEDAGGYSSNIQGDKLYSPLGLGFSPSPQNHISQMYNRGVYMPSGSGPSLFAHPNVLALKVGTKGDVSAGSNFITFYNGTNQALGAVEGNGSGGVTYKSGGADLAELLPKENQLENINPGDVVGLKNGKISKQTSEASAVMVVSDKAMILGNVKENEAGYERVAFVGQVPVLCSGPVQTGDWIVASNKNDGSAIAISSSAITLDHKIVGRALESNDSNNLKRVNTMIGMDQSTSRDIIISNMQQTIAEQELAHKSQQKAIAQLQRDIAKLKDLIIQE